MLIGMRKTPTGSKNHRASSKFRLSPVTSRAQTFTEPVADVSNFHRRLSVRARRHRLASCDFRRRRRMPATFSIVRTLDWRGSVRMKSVWYRASSDPHNTECPIVGRAGVINAALLSAAGRSSSSQCRTSPCERLEAAAMRSTARGCFWLRYTSPYSRKRHAIVRAGLRSAASKSQIGLPRPSR